MAKYCGPDHAAYIHISINTRGSSRSLKYGSNEVRLEAIRCGCKIFDIILKYATATRARTEEILHGEGETEQRVDRGEKYLDRGHNYVVTSALTSWSMMVCKKKSWPGGPGVTRRRISCSAYWYVVCK
jgi:hypothetical protein